MAEKIKKISIDTKNRLLDKSAKILTDKPRDRGLTPDEIRRKFYEPIISETDDDSNTIVGEINRVVEEINNANFSSGDNTYLGIQLPPNSNYTTWLKTGIQQEGEAQPEPSSSPEVQSYPEGYVPEVYTPPIEE